MTGVELSNSTGAVPVTEAGIVLELQQILVPSAGVRIKLDSSHWMRHNDNSIFYQIAQHKINRKKNENSAAFAGPMIPGCYC